MPRHLISDVHEWINEIPTVPIYYLAKPQPRERAWHDQRGKKTLLSLTLVWRVERRRRCRISGSLRAFEIPLLLMSLYLSRQVKFFLENFLRWENPPGGEFGWGGTSVKR